MRQILDLIPLVLFFIAYKMDGQSLQLLNYSYTFDGIFSATAVLMMATTAQIILIKLLVGKVEKQLLWLFAVIIVAGSATLILRNELFIQWKPTVFNWGMATVLFASLYIGKKSLLERMLGQQLKLPKPAWLRLNQLWITNFIVVGTLNICVAYNFSQSAWVNYKLYSAFGFTLLLMILTMVIIFPHIKDQPENVS
tara:strand:- start:2731 stop:3318 length:588 start_codon:yes stop_codon:yes gene_type:complete